MPLPPRRLHKLRPAPPRPLAAARPRVTFLDLPAELRVEIYRLALESVTVHILPQHCEASRRRPHALTLTSRRVRHEVLPLMHAHCPIDSAITDFDFDSLRQWLARIPPAQQQLHLCKNERLSVQLMTTAGAAVGLRSGPPPASALSAAVLSSGSGSCSPSRSGGGSGGGGCHPPRSLDSLRRWLRMRADCHRAQPRWRYSGSRPDDRVCKDLLRRAKRMRQPERQREMFVILGAIGVAEAAARARGG